MSLRNKSNCICLDDIDCSLICNLLAEAEELVPYHTLSAILAGGFSGFTIFSKRKFAPC